MRGRKPKPTKVKELSGAADKNPQRINQHEPPQLNKLPTCPIHLDVTGRKHWYYMCEILEGMGLLSKSFELALAVHCETYSNYRQALAAVEKYGQVLVVKKRDKGSVEVKRNPFSTELHRFKDELMKQLCEFGLTPSSKARVIASDEKKDDLFALWAKGRG